ncbi:hypothetical protein EDC96DRAFT_516679 [Choanephora cucurbitarum]|nr:hypothetical protein EDC96DRAFT_516679 [Choanephora cucurbitarum]
MLFKSSTKVDKESSQYMSSLHSVRYSCFKVQEVAAKDKLCHFDLDPSKLEDMVQLVVSILKRDHNDFTKIPSYGCWRYFDSDGVSCIQKLIDSWANVDTTEQVRRVLDLFVVFILLDCNLGRDYAFRESTTNYTNKRREGVAAGVWKMFLAGTFSADPNQPHKVDLKALIDLTQSDFSNGFENNLFESEDSLDDKYRLIKHLANVLQSRSGYFGSKEGHDRRPGNLIDYLLLHPTTIKTRKGPLIHIEAIWPVVLEISKPSVFNNSLDQLGDVWSCPTLGPNELVSFHDLSQWMVYSIIEPMEKLMGAIIEGTEQLTSPSDYPNGGLLIDTGFIALKKEDYERGVEMFHRNSLLPGQPKVEVIPMFDISDPVVIEWRALTTAYMDLLSEQVRNVLRVEKKTLRLSQIIQSGTHTAGRELAEITRPNTQEPPIIMKIHTV